MKCLGRFSACAILVIYTKLEAVYLRLLIVQHLVLTALADPALTVRVLVPIRLG